MPGHISPNRKLAAMLAQFANTAYIPWEGEKLPEVSSMQRFGDLIGFTGIKTALKAPVMDAEVARNFILVDKFYANSGTKTRTASLFGYIAFKLSPLERRLLEHFESSPQEMLQGLYGTGARGPAPAAAPSGPPASDMLQAEIARIIRAPGGMKRYVVAAFRGTIPSHKIPKSGMLIGPDIWTDLRASQTRCRFFPGKVHRGFLDTYMSCQMEIKAYLKFLTQPDGNWFKHVLRPLLERAGASRPDVDLAASRLHDSSVVLVTGHSLGAALATICAADLAASWYRPVMYNFASPTVGDGEFSRTWNKVIASSWVDAAQSHAGWRIYRPTDPVTQTPQLHIPTPRFTTATSPAGSLEWGTYEHVNNGWSLGGPGLPNLGHHSMDQYSSLVLRG